MHIRAEVAKLVDASDSKSDVAYTMCRFESGLRHLYRFLIELCQYIFVIYLGHSDVVFCLTLPIYRALRLILYFEIMSEMSVLYP